MERRKRRGSRRRVVGMVALTALILTGGAVATPLALASDGSGSGSGSDSGVASFWQRWRDTRDNDGCADVELVFARGTGEPQGLGVVGAPLAKALRSALPGKTVNAYAVVYAAEASQASAGPGATEMSKHIVSVAASCPNTRFVIGGYSQGATVTDIAIGIRTGVTRGTPIPANLADRVAAVVVYGNPLGMAGRTIAESSPVYGPKAKEFCNTGDPVCGGGGNFAAHLRYPTNGTVGQGAAFAAARISGS